MPEGKGQRWEWTGSKIVYACAHGDEIALSLDPTATCERCSEPLRGVAVEPVWVAADLRRELADSQRLDPNSENWKDGYRTAESEYVDPDSALRRTLTERDVWSAACEKAEKELADSQRRVGELEKEIAHLLNDVKDLSYMAETSREAAHARESQLAELREALKAARLRLAQIQGQTPPRGDARTIAERDLPMPNDVAAVLKIVHDLATNGLEESGGQNWMDLPAALASSRSESEGSKPDARRGMANL